MVERTRGLTQVAVALAATLAIAASAPPCASAAAPFGCVGGGRMTFEGPAAIAAWRITGSGGIDYGLGFFPPTHQARNGNEPVYANNGWLRGTTGWHAIERTLRTDKPYETLFITPYLQGSANLPPIYVTLIDPRTSTKLEEITLDVRRPGTYSEFYLSFGKANVFFPPEVVIRFGFWAPDADAWLRVGSVDIRHVTTRVDCDSSGPLREL